MASKLDCQLSEITCKSIIRLRDLDTFQKVQHYKTNKFSSKKTANRDYYTHCHRHNFPIALPYKRRANKKPTF